MPQVRENQVFDEKHVRAINKTRQHKEKITCPQSLSHVTSL